MTTPPVLRFPARPGGEPPPVLLHSGQVTAPMGGPPLHVVTRPAEVRLALTHARMAGTIPGTGCLRGHPLTGAELQPPDGGLLNMNPPGLLIYRQRIAHLFSERAVRGTRWQTEAIAARHAATLGHQAHNGQAVDASAGYALPVVSWAVMATLGLPLEDWDLVYGASNAAFALVGSPADAAQAQAAWEHLYAYYGARLHRLTGLTGQVRAALAGCTPAQTVHVLATISNGFPAVLPVLARVLAELLQRPHLVRACLAGKRSWREVTAQIIGTRALFPVGLPRYAVEGSTVDGCPVTPGTLLLPSLAAAGRLGAPPSMALGAGPHFCPGAAFTWLWVAVAVAVFFQLFPRAVLAGSLDWQPGTLSVPREIPVLLHP